MIKLKVSYESTEELARLIEILRPSMISCKKSQKTGRFHRTYITLVLPSVVKKCGSVK